MTTKNRGFTMIEILGALSILFFLTGMCLEMYSQGAKLAARSKNRMIGQQLCRQKIEMELSAIDAGGSEGYGSIAGFTGFRRVTTVADFDPVTYGAGAVKRIGVTVFWDNDRESTRLATLRTDYQ